VRVELLDAGAAAALAEDLTGRASVKEVKVSGATGDLKTGSQFLPIALCFALTTLGLAAFVQYCAMYRFRGGGWAGVALAFVFYVFMALAGMMFEKLDNTPALLNPLVYTGVVTKGDDFIDSHAITREGYEPALGPDGSGGWRTLSRRVEYFTRTGPDYDPHAAARRGLVAEALFALLCFALAYLKWARTRAEMLRGAGA